jgi:hypothetical protein
MASPPLEHHGEFDPIYGPGMGRKRVFTDLSALRSCINIFGSSWSRVVLRTILDTRAFTGQASNRPFGPRGSQAMPLLIRPVPLFVSGRSFVDSVTRVGGQADAGFDFHFW